MDPQPRSVPRLGQSISTFDPRSVMETSAVVDQFQAPNANAYAERFVRSIKHEGLDRVIPFGEQHLRRTLATFVEHYHRERNHQGLGNELIDGVSSARSDGRIRRHMRLGGLLNYYYRAA